MNATAPTYADRNLPRFALKDVKALCKRLYRREGEFKPLLSEHDLTWLVTADTGECSVLKISNRKDSEAVVAMQCNAMAHIRRRDPTLPVPQMIPTVEGEDYSWVSSALSGERHMIRMISFMPGVVAEDHPELIGEAYYDAIGAMAGRLVKALNNLFDPAARSNQHLWDITRMAQLRPMLAAIEDKELQQTCRELLDHAEAVVIPALNATRCQLVHQDAHWGNVMIDPQDCGRISALLDFGDMGYNPIVCELVIAADSTPPDVDDILARLILVAQGFDRHYPLEEAEVDLIYDAFLLRQVMTVIICAYRDQHDKEQQTHVEGEKYSRFVHQLLALGRDAAIRRIRSALGFPAYTALAADGDGPQSCFAEHFAARQQYLGEAWHFYDQALQFSRGAGAYLYTPDGTDYLDAYNNVPQVGHSHPHVVKAIARQAAALNTNTRYLCDIVADYAARLTQDLPEHLNACIFVNSGSEANDFAMQIAKSLTGNQGALVMQNAYHGCTELSGALSPEVYDSQPWLETLVIPDNYRGDFAGRSDAAERYAEDADRAIEALQRRGHSPAAFMVDTALCSNGLPEVPDQYFNRVAQKVKRAGGLVIADEVQAGCGRMGSFWGFRANGLADHHVDIITMGKPVANGHPLGVVILSRSLLLQFQHSVHNLFSTFGGNTVACAAGMAVLDVIEREGLVEKANQIGGYLRAELLRLADSQPLIGSVRGRGMMVGLEFVTDRAAKTPATDEVTRLLELMKQHRVLVGSEGADKNIFKLRPNLAWTTREVDRFVQALDSSLRAL